MGFNGDLYPSAGASVVMTTKGDMVDYNTERQRLGIGSTGQVLTVAGALPTWATLTTADSVLTTQGDVLYESGSGLARLGFGTTGDVLTTKGTGANPVWETPSGGNASTSFVAKTDGAFETNSTSFVAITGATHTIPDITSGKCLNIFNGGVASGSGATGLAFQIWDSDTGAQMSVLKLDPDTTGYAVNYTVQGINDADGQTVYCNFKQDGGSNSTLYASATAMMTLTAFAV